MVKFNNSLSHVGREIKTALLLILLSSLLAGCSTTGLRFYSATRDKQGQDLQAKLKAASDAITAKIATARENQKALLAEQLATEDKLMDEKRLILAQAMASKDSIDTKLKKPIEEKIKSFTTLTSENQINDALTQDNDNASVRRTYEYAYALAGISDTPPECQDVSDSTALAAYQAKVHVTNDNIFQAGANLHDTYCKTGGESHLGNLALTDTRQQRQKAIDELENLMIRTAVARYTVNKAEKAKVDKNTAPPSDDELQKAWNTLLGASDAFSLKFVSDKRRQQITDYLATLAATKPGEGPPKEASEAAADTILIKNFIDDYKKAQAEGKAASLVPLMMAKQFDAIQASTAQRDIDSRKAEIALLDAKLEIQLTQLKTYFEAQKQLEQIPKSKLQAPLYKLVSPNDPEANKIFTTNEFTRGAHAVILYLTAESELHASAVKLDYQRYALIHERSIAYSEANALQWQNLISTAANQLSAYGSTGVKPESVLAFINSVALIGTAVGVNK